MKTVTVLGNNSGRNAGDAAILGNLLEDFTRVRRDVRFLVPTTNAGFIRRHFGRFNARPVPMMPWNLALKNLGLPLLLAMARADMVLVCDNILFDRKFYNPVFNNLSSIALFAPLCRRRGIPIVLYNASVGPIDTPAGDRALQGVLDACPLAILRDGTTPELLAARGMRCPPIRIHADCALNTTPPPAARLDAIAAREGLFRNPNGTVGFNVNAYIDNWRMDGTLSRGGFSRMIAATVDRVIEALDVDVMFTVTQVMDLPVTRECVSHVKHPQRVRIVSNVDYTYPELAGLLSRVAVHTGLRTHTLIFCAAVHTPMVSINSYPKSAGFMSTIGQQEWTIDFASLGVAPLTRLILRAWRHRERTRETLGPIVEREKEKARASAQLVCDML